MRINIAVALSKFKLKITHPKKKENPSEHDEQKERRKSPRVDLDTKVRYQVLGHPSKEVISQDISTGGMCLLLDRKISPRMILELEFKLPVGQGLVAQAVILELSQLQGFGMNEFRRFEPGQLGFQPLDLRAQNKVLGLDDLVHREVDLLAEGFELRPEIEKRNLHGAALQMNDQISPNPTRVHGGKGLTSSDLWMSRGETS